MEETDGEMEGGAPNPCCWGWDVPSPCPGCCCRLVTQGRSTPSQPSKRPAGSPGAVMLPHLRRPLSPQVGLQAHQEAHPLDGAQPRLAPQQRPPGRWLLRLQVPVRHGGGG